MRQAAFFEGRTPWPFQRQTPNGDGVWGDTQFRFGGPAAGADWVIVLDRLDGPVEAPRNRSLFLAGEPMSVHRYHPDFLAQFAVIVTTDTETPHPHRIIANPALPWHVGIASRRPESYATAMSWSAMEQRPRKAKLCSCICSDKAFTPEHRARLAFVERLQHEFGEAIDFFGRGFRDMEDKNEALEDYRYHIALENSVFPHYWTEKLADAYLRNCFPIYGGAPNIHDYFAADALVAIDIADPDRAIATIRDMLASDMDVERAAAVDMAKRRVMEEYNLLAMADRLMGEIEARNPEPGERIRIHPEARFLPPPPKRSLIERALGKAKRTVAAWRIGANPGA